jgi:hypothetical protein
VTASGDEVAKIAIVYREVGGEFYGGARTAEGSDLLLPSAIPLASAEVCSYF